MRRRNPLLPCLTPALGFRQSAAGLLRISMLLGLLVIAHAVRADTGPEQLTRFLEGLETLSARFEQSVVSTTDGSAAYARGSLYLWRPGRLRWEYEEPEQLIVADGERVWMHDIELEQISHRGQQAALEGTPALLLSDTDPLEENFEVRDGGHRSSFQWVELRPKYKDSEFTRILLAFSDNALYRMDIADNFGQVTRFRFFRVRRNPPLDPELFEFEPPSGIDLISED